MGKEETRKTFIEGTMIVCKSNVVDGKVTDIEIESTNLINGKVKRFG